MGISDRKNLGDVASTVKWSTKGALERSQGIYSDGDTEGIPKLHRHRYFTLTATPLPPSSAPVFPII